MYGVVDSCHAQEEASQEKLGEWEKAKRKEQETHTGKEAASFKTGAKPICSDTSGGWNSARQPIEEHGRAS
jgi:hypothetical protein